MMSLAMGDRLLVSPAGLDHRSWEAVAAGMEWNNFAERDGESVCVWPEPLEQVISEPQLLGVS